MQNAHLKADSGDRKSKGQNVPLKSTSEKIAEEHKIKSDKTVKNAEKFTAVNIDWTFRWFRYITPLEPKYQKLFGACVQEPLILPKMDKCRILNNLTILGRKPTVSFVHVGVSEGVEGIHTAAILRLT